MSPWDKVLQVVPMVEANLPRGWRCDHLDDMRQECYLALHKAAAYRPKDWPPYAWVTIRRALHDYMQDEHTLAETVSVEGFGDTPRSEVWGEPATVPAERCRHCGRSLLTKDACAELRPVRALEARKHSERLCQACHKRPRKPTACGECGDPYVPHGRQAYCSDKCRHAAKRRRNARNAG